MSTFVGASPDFVLTFWDPDSIYRKDGVTGGSMATGGELTV